jgi:tetratricopeptide (TPR) repeat protein
MSVIKQIFFVIILLLIGSSAFSGYHEDGVKFYNYRNYEKAKELFLKSVEASDNGYSYFFLGEIEMKEENYEKAEEYYKLSVSKFINAKYKQLAYWNIVIIQERKGRYNEMVITCRELWEKMNNSAAKSKVESLINKFLWSENEEAKLLYGNGMEYKKKNESEKSKEAFYNALRADSNFLAPKFELGLLQYNQNNISQSIDYLKEVVEKIPFYGEVHLLLGEIYFNKQSYNNSAEHFSKALEYGFFDNKTKYSIITKTGTAYYETGDLDNAEQMFKLAIESNTKALEPLLLISAIYIKKNNYEQALSSLLKAKDLDPNNQEILFQLGSIYYKLNDQKFAYYFQQLFNKTITAKDTVPLKYYKAFTLLLKNNYENKKYDDAIKIFDALPDSQKTNEINLTAARSYFYFKKYEKAIEYFEKLSLGDEDKFLLCASYARTGMTAKAKDLLINLLTNEEFSEKVKTDPTLKKISDDIRNERIKKEEEEKRKEEKLKEDSLKMHDNTDEQLNIQKEPISDQL